MYFAVFSGVEKENSSQVSKRKLSVKAMKNLKNDEVQLLELVKRHTCKTIELGIMLSSV